jgi:hypothetical protein
MVVAGVVILLVIFVMARKHPAAPPPAPSPAVAAPAATPMEAPSPASTPSPVPAPSETPSPGALPTRAGATTEVELRNPVMCKAVKNDASPLDATTVFGPRDPLFCSVEARNLKVGTEITAVWEDPNGSRFVKKATSDVSGRKYVFFSVQPRPDRPWPIGRYKIYLLADGVLQQTVPFEVVSPGMSPAPTSTRGDAASHVETAVICRSVDKRHRPVDPTTTFSPSTSAVYVAVHVLNVTGGKIVNTRWYKGERPIKQIPITVPRDGSGWLSFELTSQKEWPTGDYKVEILYDGQLATTAPFSVR